MTCYEVLTELKDGSNITEYYTFETEEEMWQQYYSEHDKTQIRDCYITDYIP